VNPITPAASVLLSPGPGAPEVFAVQRGTHLKFFGGFWAFPGGRLDPDDLALAGETEATLAALRIAACRELFEEAGVLIARPFLPAAEDLDRLRRAVLDGRLTFTQLLSQRGLTIHADDFRLIGQLTTPPFSPVRFATTFFTAYLPPGQQATVWPGELESGVWKSAHGLLEDWHRPFDGLLLTPPAITILRALDGAPIDRAPAQLSDEFARLTGDALPEILFAPEVRAIPLRTAVLPPATHTNAFLVGDSCLIDPGADDAAEQQRLLALLDQHRSRTRRLQVLLTHHHPDHVGAVEACVRHCHAEVLAHPLTAERLRGRITVDRVVNHGDKVDVSSYPGQHGPLCIQAIHTPGHAPGHLAFWEPNYGLLFAGDMVSTQTSIVISPPDGDLTVYLDSLRLLRSFSARLLLPAHGNVSAQSHAVIDAALAHRAKREAQLLEALAAGPATLDALAPVLYRGVPEALWRFARAQLLAGLIKLEREQRVRRIDEERWELC
jgi:endoribonuclease LACTB2